MGVVTVNTCILCFTTQVHGDWLRRNEQPTSIPAAIIRSYTSVQISWSRTPPYVRIAFKEKKEAHVSTQKAPHHTFAHTTGILELYTVWERILGMIWKLPGRILWVGRCFFCYIYDTGLLVTLPSEVKTSFGFQCSCQCSRS